MKPSNHGMDKRIDEMKDNVLKGMIYIGMMRCVSQETARGENNCLKSGNEITERQPCFTLFKTSVISYFHKPFITEVHL